MANRLSTETSPYLRQHAENPVDWLPWGAEAFERARRENKPILLSIGYAACHWCHVMAHESFEDETTARLMNERFVSIKVDREERPDVDAIYMTAVQAMTGHGGWPMTVFLTPDGVPFYGGTYFPSDDRHGIPSFQRVLRSVSDAYRERPADIARSAESVRALFEHASAGAQPTGALAPVLLDRAFRGLAQQYDARHGGFGGAPKFPPTMALDFLLRYWRRTGAAQALEMVRDTFRHMARGGIYDQLGGGFHRYSVDAVWLVPHFEKMLYDNALLVRLGAHLWQATGDAEVRRVTEETIDWAAREMSDVDGGFFSSLDADSEGEEGRFYVWEKPELDRLLGEDAPIVEAYWGVTPEGNFEGRNILHVPNPATVVAARNGVDAARVHDAVARARPVLYDARAARPWPARDDKILAAWNGLMLRGVAEAARIFARDDYERMALRAGEFLFARLVRDGRVMRSYMEGEARIPGFLEDHAALGLGALALYELTFDDRWLRHARELGTAVVDWFWDDGARAFYDTARDAEALIARPRDATDNATPSGTSLAVDLLLRLAELGQDASARERVERVLEAMAEPMARYPQAFGHLLGVADMTINGAVEVALVGAVARADFLALVRAVAARYVPALVLAGGPPEEAANVALLAGRPMLDGMATAYVCREYACDRPTADPGTLGEQLERAGSARG